MASAAPATREQIDQAVDTAVASAQPRPAAGGDAARQALNAAVDAAVASAKPGAGTNPAIDAAVDQAIAQAKSAVAAASAPMVTIPPAASSGAGASASSTTATPIAAAPTTLPGTAPVEPASEIKQLDAKLAVAAGKAETDEFEDVSPQLQVKATAVAAPAPDVKATAPTTPAGPASAAAPAVSKTSAAAAPAPAPHAGAAALPVKAETPATSLGRRVSPLLRPLEPIAVRLGRIAPSRRQTIGWIALMTAFNAAWVWGYVLLKSPSKSAAPEGGKSVLTGKAEKPAETPAPKAEAEAPADAHAPAGHH